MDARIEAIVPFLGCVVAEVLLRLQLVTSNRAKAARNSVFFILKWIWRKSTKKA